MQGPVTSGQTFDGCSSRPLSMHALYQLSQGRRQCRKQLAQSVQHEQVSGTIARIWTFSSIPLISAMAQHNLSFYGTNILGRLRQSSGNREKHHGHVYGMKEACLPFFMHPKPALLPVSLTMSSNTLSFSTTCCSWLFMRLPKHDRKRPVRKQAAADEAQ